MQDNMKVGKALVIWLLKSPTNSKNDWRASKRQM